MLAPTNRCRRWLRRYESAPCPLMPGEHSYHNVCVLGEDGDLVRFDDETVTAAEFSFNDPRWPTHCGCGFAFTAEKGARQTFFLEIYLTPDGKECTTHPQPPAGIEVAPVGSMWFADWFSWKGPDGHALTVMTPGGEWCIDGPASGSGRPWTRTGTPPKVTASPSIHIIGKYHGWLRDGILSDC